MILIVGPRKMWSNAISLSKAALSAEQAKSLSKELLTKGSTLRDMLQDDGEVVFNEEMKNILVSCKSFLDVCSTLDSEDDANMSMNALMTEIRARCDDKASPQKLDDFHKWLDEQWASTSLNGGASGLSVVSVDELASLAGSLTLRGPEFPSLIADCAFHHSVIRLDQINWLLAHYSFMHSYLKLYLPPD